MAAALALLVSAALPARAQLRPVLIQGGNVLAPDGGWRESASLILQNGKIGAVGDKLSKPLLAVALRAKGKYVTPGLIDACSTLALDAPAGGGTAFARAADAFDPYADDELRAAFQQGITAIYAPARHGGLGSVIRLVPGNAEGRVLVAEAALSAAITLDENQGPVARVKAAEELRKRFRAAREYREAWNDYEESLKEYEQKLAERAKKEQEKNAKATAADGKDEPNQPEAPAEAPEAAKDAGKEKKEEELKKPAEPQKDRQMEVLLKVLDGELRWRVEAHDPADILNVLEIADEFGVAVVIEGGAGAHRVAADLARRNTPVVLAARPPSLAFTPGILRYASDETAAVLRQAGVPVGFGSGVVLMESAPLLTLRVARAVAAGFDEKAALRALTTGAAELLGVDDIGRIAPGATADVVVWSAHPLSPAARVERVYLGGIEVYRARDAVANEE